MRPVDKLYHWLKNGPAPECDQVLGAALDHAEPEYADRIRDVLFARASEASWTALLSHYELLSGADQRRIIDEAGRARSALASILRSGTPGARINALGILERHPSLKLAHMLVDLLRHENPAIHRFSAVALRKIAEVTIDYSLFNRPVPTPLDDDWVDRSHLIRALRDAVRSFELHCRLEVLEAALWFARDIGDALWKKLDDRKSDVGRIVDDNLELWSTPRMSGMLLECLTRQNWRQHARDILATWSQRDHLIALLRQSSLLADPHLRRHLPGIKNPRWFTEVDGQLADLPADLRLKAPEWARLAGFSDSERIGMLARWCDSPDVALQRASIEALVAVDHPDAVKVLRSLASWNREVAGLVELLTQPTSDSPQPGSGPMIETPRSVAPPAAATVAQPAPPPEPPPAAEEPAPLKSDFAVFWQVCRRRPVREGDDLIELIRDAIDRWRRRVVGALQSSDPRDRVLGLRVIGTSELAHQFRDEIAVLCSDPIEGIRRLASELAGFTAATPGEKPPGAQPPPPERWPGLDSAADRSRYDDILAQLLDPDTGHTQALELVTELCALIARCARQTRSTVRH